MRYMAPSTSYRLPAGLKQRLAKLAKTEGVSETALVSRFLEQGLRSAAHPGIVFRPGPTGWRAGLSGGPDIDEVIRAVRASEVKGDKAVHYAAESLGLHEGLVRKAVDYAAEYLGEIEERIAANDEVIERVKLLSEARTSILS